MKNLSDFDASVIALFRRYGSAFARIGLFVIFFWFGILKVFAVSPAGPLVTSLFNETFLAGVSAATFSVYFGVFEMLIGVMALFKSLERYTFALLLFHLATTMLPLFLLPEAAWQAPFVPTLTGQYIFKNIALLAVSIFLFADLKPLSHGWHRSA